MQLHYNKELKKMLQGDKDTFNSNMSIQTKAKEIVQAMFAGEESTPE